MRLAIPKPLICPQCGESICAANLNRSLNKWECPRCGAHVRFAKSYELFMILLTILFALFVGTATYGHDSGGTWLLGVLVSSIAVQFLFPLYIRPWLQLGSYQPKGTIVGSALWISTYLFLLELLAVVGFSLHVVSREAYQDNLETLSLPLALLNRNFLLNPDKRFSDICGVLLGNSVIYGLVVFACYKVVHRAFLKSKVTQLSLSPKNPTDEDD